MYSGVIRSSNKMMSILRLAHLTAEQIQLDWLRLAHAGLVHRLSTLQRFCLHARCSLAERALPTTPQSLTLIISEEQSDAQEEQHTGLFPGVRGHRATCTQRGDGEGAPGARWWRRGPWLQLSRLDRCGSPVGFCCRRLVSSALRLKVGCVKIITVAT